MIDGDANTMIRDVLIGLARFDPTHDDDIVSALEQFDYPAWAQLLVSASTHRLMGNLTRICAGLPTAPGEIAYFCARQYGYLRREAAIRGAESDAIVLDLARTGIKPIPLKGYVLSRQCYVEPWLREIFDLDLLIRPRYLEATVNRLHAAGYSQSEVTPTGDLLQISDARLQGYEQELQHLGEFTKPGPGGPLLSIDVHFRLSTVFDHIAPQMEVFFDNTHVVEGCGYEQFRPELFVAHLAYHAWWDTQSLANVRARTDLRLGQYSDILLAFKAWDLRCNDVLDWAEEAGIGAAANWALWLTGALFGELPRQECVKSADAVRFDAHFTDRWLQRSTASTIGTWRKPAPERMFDPLRSARASDMLVHWLDSHAKRGDVLTWDERG